MNETPLEAELKRLIAEDGPISLSGYMALALGHPAHGYYMGRDPFGARGDFITAPEISQIFGELVGIWVAAAYQMLGAPKKVNLVELGPGRGTLMADMLRAASVMPGFSQSVQVHLVETSPALQQNQKVKLARTEVPITWHENFESVPDDPLIVIANEFFDALPVQQYQFGETGWCERMVGLNLDDKLVLGLFAQPLNEASIPVWARDGQIGDIFEISQVRDVVAEQIAGKIVNQNGYGLFIDYGHAASAIGDTLQAMSRHEYVDVLFRPGFCDITSHVDFNALGKTFSHAGGHVYGPIAQGPFLDAMGLDIRAQRLCANASRRQVRAIEAAIKRLASRDQMGELFKVMAVSGPDVPVPAPFEGVVP